MSDNICILKKDVQKNLIDIGDILVSNIKGIKKYNYSINDNLVSDKENTSYSVTLRFGLSNHNHIRIRYYEFIRNGFHYYELIDKDYLGISITHVYYDKFLKHIEKLYSRSEGGSNE